MEMLLALDVATTRWTLKTMFVARVERTCACGTRFCGNQLLRSDLRGCIGWTLLTCKLRSGLQASFVRLAFILVVTMLRGLKLRCIYGLLFSAISEDPLHIGNYKLAANYGCFRADQRIHFYNVCFSAACCGGNVHLWETAWLPGVIRLQGMEIAHVQISFVVDVVCLQASFVCFDFRACCHYAWDLEIRQMLLWFASPTYAGRHAAHWKPQAWCQRWLQRKQLINALWLFEVTFDCTSLLLVEAGMLTTGTFLSCHKEGTKA